MSNRYLLAAFAMILSLAAFVQFADSQMGPFLDHQSIHFDSEPSLTGQVGTPYIYAAHLATKDSTAVVRYGTDRMDPPGFSIDSASGVVHWIPAARGWYSLSIVALYNLPGSNLFLIFKQQFVVAVAGGNGIVEGTVTDTLNSPIPNAVIELLQASSPKLPGDGCYSYVTRTDSAGNYRISKIDPGDYKLHVISPSPQYASQWFNDQTNAEDANKISIADSPAVTTVFISLTAGKAKNPKIVVSGIVTDSLLLPIVNSHVFFVRAGFALNSNINVDDFRRYFDMDDRRYDYRLEGRSAEVFETKTDSLGNFSLQIPSGAYIAFAKAPGFGKVFYPGQSDMLSATLLMLRNDSAGINFILPKLPSIALGTIEGNVIDSALDVGVPSRIIAFRNRWTDDDKFGRPRSYVVDTDSLGNYTVDDLLPGSYFVLAVPLGNYVPAFYTSDTITTRWQKAAKVIIKGNTAAGIDIFVHRIPDSTEGFASISGSLSLSAGTAATMAGAIVYATEDNEVSGFAITDAAGNYSIDGLAPGTYSLSVDKPGFTETTASSGTVSYSSTGSPKNANVPLSISSITLVEGITELQPVQYTLEQNFPNPFNPSTTIRYTLPVSGRVLVRIYNILGQEVATLIDGNQDAGTHVVSFNASGLASGVYLYRVESGSFSSVKKMVLIK